MKTFNVKQANMQTEMGTERWRLFELNARQYVGSGQAGDYIETACGVNIAGVRKNNFQSIHVAEKRYAVGCCWPTSRLPCTHLHVRPWGDLRYSANQDLLDNLAEYGPTHYASLAAVPKGDHDQAVKDGWLQPPPNANSWAEYCDKQLGWD